MARRRAAIDTLRIDECDRTVTIDLATGDWGGLLSRFDRSVTPASASGRQRGHAALASPRIDNSSSKVERTTGTRAHQVEASAGVAECFHHRRAAPP